MCIIFRKNPLLILALSTVFVLPVADTWADGAPLAFDQFQAGDTGSLATSGNVAGQINADCTASTTFINAGAAVTCGEATLSNGMLQRQVYVSGGGAAVDGTYIQFIMTEAGAQGDATAAAFSTERGSLYFTNEDFIKMNNRGSGIASKQTILDASFDSATNTEERFQNVVAYNVGWANGTQTPWVDIMQDLTQLRYDDSPELATMAKELMNEHINIISDGANPSNVFDDTKVEISQRLTMEDEHTVNPANDGIQKFKHTRLTGKYNTTGTDLYTGINANPLLLGGTNGGNIGWNNGDAIVANWIGYEQIDPSFSNIFGFTSFENQDKTKPLVGSFTQRISFSDPEAGGPAPACPSDNAIIYYLYNSGTGQCDAYLVSGDVYAGSLAPTAPGGWAGIIDVNTNTPLFGAVEAMADVTSYGATTLTDYTVMDPIIILPPSDNLNYIANSTALPTANSDLFQPTDSDYNNWTVSNGVFNVSTCPGDPDDSRRWRCYRRSEHGRLRGWQYWLPG